MKPFAKSSHDEITACMESDGTMNIQVSLTTKYYNNKKQKPCSFSIEGVKGKVPYCGVSMCVCVGSGWTCSLPISASASYRILKVTDFDEKNPR